MPIGKKPLQGSRRVTISKHAEPGAAGKATQIFDEIDSSLPWASLRISSQQVSHEGSLSTTRDNLEALIKKEREN